MTVLQAHRQSRDLIPRPRALGDNNLKLPLLERPTTHLVVPVRKRILVELNLDTLARARVEDDLGEAFEFLVRSAEAAFNVVDVDLDDVGAGDGASVGHGEREGNLYVFDRGPFFHINLGIGPV